MWLSPHQSLLDKLNFLLNLYEKYQLLNRLVAKFTKLSINPHFSHTNVHGLATPLVEPYNASRQPKFQFCPKLVKIVTFMCARGPAPHVARGRKHCKRMASLYKHMGKLQRAVTLILRCESKFLKVKSLHSIHSAHRCKNYVPKCSQFPPELII